MAAEKLDQIKALLDKRAEGKLDYDNDQKYQRLRSELLDDSGLAEKLPELIRASRSTNDVWTYLRQFRTWQERREYVAKQLRPAFEYIEQQHRRPAPVPDFAPDTEAFFSKLAQWLMAHNQEREVAILTGGTGRLALSSVEVWDGTPWNIEIGLPLDFYNALTKKERDQAQDSLLEAARTITRTKGDDFLHAAHLFVDIDPIPEWRTHALTFLRREGITNQARVRSDNLPALERDGLRFRSQPEVHMYAALKRAGLLFAPLPVFLRGGNTYQRLEPDFIVFEKGTAMLIEIDGDSFHRELPAEAHARTNVFNVEGAFIQRVKAAECSTEEKAAACARCLLEQYRTWQKAR